MPRFDSSRLVPLCVLAAALACGSSVSPGSDDAGTDAGTAPVTCGNGMLDPGEECDDGNRVSFDGCSASCQLEQSQRVDWMQMEFATDSACAANALGGAIVLNAAQTQLQAAIIKGVGNGSINVLMELLGTHDLAGTDATGLSIGILSGKPQQPTGAPAYDGSSDLDWWYSPDVNSVDANGAPLARLSASISGGKLIAGPGALTLNVTFGAGVASMLLSDAVVAATIGPLSAPLESPSALPPGHLPDEHVSPTLESFTSAGAPNASGAATLCGHVSAKSLSTTALSSAVISVCTSFTTSNSLLDLLVAGCKALGVVQAVAATQPDQVDQAQPVAGAGAPYKLSASSGVTVNTCKDKHNTVVDLNTCLTAAAYSSYFKFATDRVIIRN